MNLIKKKFILPLLLLSIFVGIQISTSCNAMALEPKYLSENLAQGKTAYSSSFYATGNVLFTINALNYNGDMKITLQKKFPVSPLNPKPQWIDCGIQTLTISNNKGTFPTSGMGLEHRFKVEFISSRLPSQTSISVSYSN